MADWDTTFNNIILSESILKYRHNRLFNSVLKPHGSTSVYLKIEAVPNGRKCL